MKAVIITSDKLSLGILQSSLAGLGFSEGDILVFETSAIYLAEKDYQESVLLLDLDLAFAPVVIADLDPSARLLTFGMQDAPKKVNGIPDIHFMPKPFSRTRLESLLKQVLLAGVDLPAEPAGQLRQQDLQALEKEWLRLNAEVGAERQRITALLQAAPEQLRLLLSDPRLHAGNEGREGRDQNPSPDALPLKSVLIVEPDEAVAQFLSRLLARKCVLSADICADGKQAWGKLMTERYDAVIMNWDLEGLSGLAVYNRIRMTRKLQNLPLVITSNQVTARDFRLLDEDFLAVLIEKPLQEKALSDALDRLLASSLVAGKYLNPLLDVTMQAVEGDVFRRSSPPLKDDDILRQSLKLTGERLLRAEALEEAERAYAIAWALGDRRLSFITGYAKACHLAGKHRQARELLLTADALAPKNVERLCLLGELDLILQNPEEAKRRFDSVLEVDPGIKKAKAGQHVAETILEQGSNLPNVPTGIHQFSAYLNMVGIALSRDRQTQNALRYYKSALVFVREREKRAKVWFNIGICHLRAGEPGAARPAFRMAHKLSDGKLTKAQKYLQPGQSATSLESSWNGKNLEIDDDSFEKI